MTDHFDPGGGFAPMPSEPYRERTGPDPVPASVVNAVRLMFVRVAISIIDIIIVVATKNTLKKDLLDKHPDYDPDTLNHAVNVGIAIGIVAGIVFTVLYTLLAIQVRKGKNWARIVTWVFAGLGILGALGSLAQTQPAATRLVGVVVGVLDVAIIVLLARGESNEFFRPRRPAGY